MYVPYATGYLSIFCFLQTPIVHEGLGKFQLVIDNNPLTCDCKDYDIIAKLRIFTRSDWLSQVVCNLPSQLHGDEVSFIAYQSTNPAQDLIYFTYKFLQL